MVKLLEVVGTYLQIRDFKETKSGPKTKLLNYLRESRDGDRLTTPYT